MSNFDVALGEYNAGDAGAAVDTLSFPRHRTVWLDLSDDARAVISLSPAVAFRYARDAMRRHGADLAILRTGPPVAGGLMPHAWCEVVHKEVTPPTPATCEFAVRSIRNDDWSFVFSRFAESVRAGIPGCIRDAYDVGLQRIARDRLIGILDADCLALVCEIDGIPCGYSLATHEGDFVHVHDTLIDPAHQNCGISTELHRVGQAWAYQRGALNLRGTVSLEDSVPAQALLARLAQAGWKTMYRYFVVPQMSSTRRPSESEPT